MAVSEVRTQIYLEREQHEALKRAARQRAVSMARIIREAIATYLVERGWVTTELMHDDAYLADAAWKIPSIADEIGGSGREDGAARLEEELYGPIES